MERYCGDDMNNLLVFKYFNSFAKKGMKALK